MGEPTSADQKPQPLTKFFIIFAGQSFSLLGSQLVQFSLVWWLTKIFGSASVLAFASIMAILPQVFLAPFAGTLVDRLNRRKVMVVADVFIALAVIVLGVLYAQDAVQVWHIYVLMFIRSVGGAFHWPAMQASTTLMVPGKHLSRVAGLNQSLHGLANIAAPPLGALLLEVMPMQGVLAIDVGTAMLAITPLLFIPIPQPTRIGKAATGQFSVLVDLREGLRYLRGLKGVLIALVIAMVSNLLVTPAMSLKAILVAKHFGGGALEFAWMQSAFGVGVVLGGVTLGVWGGFKRRMVTGLLALILMGIGITVVGLTPSNAFVLALGATFFHGFMNPIANGSMFAVMQAIVPPEMQGRFFTLVLSGATAMTPLGLAIAGPVADALGVQSWFLIGGASMVAMGASMFSIPSIVRIEDNRSGGLIAGENE